MAECNGTFFETDIGVPLQFKNLPFYFTTDLHTGRP
jgi:hypothetical protein